MNSALWGTLIGAVVAVLGALTSYINSRAASGHADAAQKSADTAKKVVNGNPASFPPSPPATPGA